MLALNGADQLNGPRQWGSLLFCLVIVLSLQRAEGSTEETGSSYTKIRILPGDDPKGTQRRRRRDCTARCLGRIASGLGGSDPGAARDTAGDGVGPGSRADRYGSLSMLQGP